MISKLRAFAEWPPYPPSEGNASIWYGNGGFCPFPRALGFQGTGGWEVGVDHCLLSGLLAAERRCLSSHPAGADQVLGL